MALDGECIKDIFYLIPTIPIGPDLEHPLDLPTNRSKSDCCSKKAFKVLADLNSDDPFKNDVTGFLWWFNDVVNSVSMTLTKYSLVTGDYEDVEILQDDTFGTFYDYGFFTNGFSEKFVGYQLEWKKVLEVHGPGSYIVRLDASSAIGNTGQLKSSEYCMNQYTPQRADGTVKIEYYINGIMGVNEDDLKRRDYGSINWYNSMRLDGIFSFIKSGYEKDYTRYNNGSRQWVKDEQEPELKLLLKPIPWKVHEIIRTDVLQADQILITDYNSRNFAKWIQKSVQSTSEYSPKFYLNQSELASVTLTFRQAINNNKRLRG